MLNVCGELQCPEYYMCQSHDLQCYPCNSYCDQTSHNFDAIICERQCQDYIKHYVKAEDIQDLPQDKEMIQKFLITLNVMLVIITFVITIYYITTIKRACKRIEDSILKLEKERTMLYLKKNKALSKFKNNAVSIVSETLDKSTMMATQTSSSSNKFPSEDITLENQDFTGHDNLGMVKVSPEFC